MILNYNTIYVKGIRFFSKYTYKKYFKIKNNNINIFDKYKEKFHGKVIIRKYENQQYTCSMLLYSINYLLL